MVNFITYFSVGADNWLVANPRDMDGFVQTLDQARPTVFMGVNTLYAGLVAHPKITEVNFSNLRLSGGGGAAVIAATSAKWQEITGQIIREGYGLSETSPVLTFNPMYLTEFLRPRACRCRRPTSSCWTTRDGRSASARPAKSAPRARR